METKMSERESAMKVANKILDTPYIDPDGDMCILSRQFLRALERENAELGDGEPSPAPEFGKCAKCGKRTFGGISHDLPIEIRAELAEAEKLLG